MEGQMLAYLKGNVLGDSNHAHCRIIVHGVNCKGAMGAGVAKAIKEKWPKVYNEYKEYLKDNSYVPYAGFDDTILGQINVVDITQPKSEISEYIINAFTQNDIRNKNDPFKDTRRYVSYDAVDNAMKRIAVWHKSYGENKGIGMPKIGCGLGGGEWSIIESIIKHRLNGINTTIYEL